jgi:FkbM family methyltransferase
MDNIFDLKNTRKLHSYTYNNKNYYYVEWNHPKEGAKDIHSLINAFSNTFNWNKLIKKNSTVIDIGAHSGDTLIPITTLCTNGTILCIEPNSNVREILQINAELNKGAANIIVASEVVTTTNTDSILLFDHNNEHCNGGIIDNSLSKESVKKIRSCAVNSIECKGLTLEAICNKYLSKEQINNLDFIKIDTEGHDKSIIRSAKEFLNKHKPNLFIEWFNWFNEEDNNDLFNTIQTINYVPYDPITLKPANVKNKISDLLLIHKTKVASCSFIHK